MTCQCGYADECDGEYGTHYPLQDGGMCAVTPCKNRKQKMSDHYRCKRCGLRYDDCHCPYIVSLSKDEQKVLEDNNVIKERKRIYSILREFIDARDDLVRATILNKPLANLIIRTELAVEGIRKELENDNSI